MLVRSCALCGVEFQPRPRASAQKYCDACGPEAKRKRQRQTPPERSCERCAVPFEPYSGVQKFCSGCKVEADRERHRVKPDGPPITRRCRNKDCIERFVPVNDQHWYHEPACNASPNKWGVDDILREEGSLHPEANNLEIAKRAFGQKNQVLRRLTQTISLRDYLTFEIQNFHDEHPEYRFPKIPQPPKDKGKKGEVEVIVQCSDWQLGKWEEGFGVEATMERVERLKGSVRSIVQRQRDAGFKVNRIILAFGGDMIEGCYIYGGQNVSGLDRTGNTHRLTRQIQQCARVMAEMAVDAATYIDQVECKVVGGNHGRTNGKNDYADPEDNFDVMAGWWASDITSANKRIAWDVYDDWWGGFQSMGHYVVTIHGDQWRGPTERLETLLPGWVVNGVFREKPDILLTHHRHSLAEREIGGITVLQNGTIDGGSKWYLKNYGRASRPAQRVLVMSEKYAPESDWKVWF